jgi:hypothetical protein
MSPDVWVHSNILIPCNVARWSVKAVARTPTRELTCSRSFGTSSATQASACLLLYLRAVANTASHAKQRGGTDYILANSRMETM